jgi:hypothetical protein
MRRALACSALVGLLLVVSVVHPLRDLAKVPTGALVGAVSSGRSYANAAATPNLRKAGVSSELGPPALESRLTLAPAASYDLTWWTVDGGGYTFSRGGEYTLGGTIGQPEANVLRGGGLTLAGGFWGGGETVTVDLRIYLPLVLRGS